MECEHVVKMWIPPIVRKIDRKVEYEHEMKKRIPPIARKIGRKVETAPTSSASVPGPLRPNKNADRMGTAICTDVAKPLS